MPRDHQYEATILSSDKAATDSVKMVECGVDAALQELPEQVYTHAQNVLSSPGRCTSSQKLPKFRAEQKRLVPIRPVVSNHHF